MAYHVPIVSGPPDFVDGEISEWKERFPDIDDRVDISRAFNSGLRPLCEGEAPLVLLLSRRRAKLRDCFVSASGIHIVSEPMKQLIEELDPGVHQLWPVTIERGPEAPFWGLNVHVRQTTIIEDASDVRRLGVNPPPGWENSPYPMAVDLSWKNLTFQSHAMGPFNLWREHRYRTDMFVSNRFADELKQRKLKFLKMKQGQEA